MKEIATFGAGCFWGVEELYRQTPGVISTRVGYSGGNTVNPTYESVCEGNTNHAEVVEITYDSSKITYEHLLTLFWKNHNPTTINRQGYDIGTQYRSIIFYHNQNQKEIAEKSLIEAQKKFSKPIVTIIEKAKTFYKAEDYHQQYLSKKGLRTCHF